MSAKSTDIPFVRDIVFEYENYEPLSPLVARVMANNPGPYTYTGTGVFIIGADTVAIIDPGPHTPDHTKAVDNALIGKTLSHIFLTHHHADHSPLSGYLSRKYGAPIYGLPAPAQSTTNDIKLEEGNDPSFKLDFKIKDGQYFHGPDWTIEAVTTPGHTSNHVCYMLHQEDTLFSGDHIMGWATSVVIPPDGNMGAYLDSLQKVQRLAPSIIRPTHGPKISETAPFLKAYIGHRYAREAQIEAAVKAGHDTVSEIVKAVYTGLDPRLIPAASLSALSHLIHLAEQGKITSDTPPSLSGHYTSC